MIPKTETKKAVIYCRVSTKEQVEDGNSLTTQERICRDYCLKTGYEIAGLFIEQGESAKTADRTELQKLLAFCTSRKHQVKALIIYKLDRLSRNTDDYSQIRILLRRYGVEIRSTSEHFENTPVGRFMENTIANVAQFDNDIRTERCMGGMREAMREGRYVWLAPVGYVNSKSTGKCSIQPCEKMGPIMQEAFNMIASNKFSISETLDEVTKLGLANKKGKPIRISYFYEALRNELYIGWIIKWGERIKGKFTPLIAPETFDRVQRVIRGRVKRTMPNLIQNPDFPLRRFIQNAEGKALTGSWSTGRKQKYPYYRFGGNSTNHNRDTLDKLFEEFLNTYAFDAVNFKKLAALVDMHLMKATNDRKNTAEKMRRQIQDLTERQRILVDKNLQGVISDAVLTQQLVTIERELGAIKDSLHDVEGEFVDYEEALEFVQDYLENPGSTWRDASLEVKTKLQWFHFPKGIRFENGSFGTSEICCIFKLKGEFCASNSAKVHLNVLFWNQIGKELCTLWTILQKRASFG